MPTDDNHRLKHLIETQRRIAYLREELDEAREAASTARSERFRAEREAQALAEAAARKARVEMLEAMQAVPQQSGHAPPPAAGSMTHPTMVEVIDQFLSAMGAQGETPMLTKHRTCLPMLRDMVGGLRTSEVKQAHLNEFFNLILQLPPNWKKRPDLLKTGWVAVAQGNTGDVIAQGTFEGTYKASISVFLNWAIGNYQDEGLSPHLTLTHIRYTGARAGTENKQRALEPEELRRLIAGKELHNFAADGAEVHKFWILAALLYSGARVNELCQINPQVDWLRVDGVDLLSINESTESDEGVVKTVKNKPSIRDVPIHPALIEAGFLDYLQAVRDAGARRLFPQWSPKRGKASWRAEEWIRTFFEEIGLRDSTKGKRVVGAHAFRSTFIKAGVNADVQMLGNLTGHARAMDPQVSSYAGGSNALKPSRKLEEMRKIRFDVELPRAVLPVLAQVRRSAR